MSTTSPLPPSGRDFLVYQRLVVDGASTRMVADEVRVSQTRVRQIVLRVTQWLVETLPAADSQLSEAAQLRLGQHIAADRLERFYVVTNRAWEETSQTKFANLCIRIIAAQTKLPAMPGTLEALAADAIYGPLPDDPAEIYPAERAKTQYPASSIQPQASAPTSTSGQTTLDFGPRTLDPNPPLRDCSPSPPPTPKSNGQPLHSSAAISLPAMPSATLPPTARAARSAFFAPAQFQGDAADEAPVAELKITPTDLGLSAKPRLTRRERRRRRLALAK